MSDLERVFEGLISAIASSVGGDLATTEGLDRQIPAIFQDRQGNYKLYPYITVDALSIKEVGGWLKDKIVDENDKTEYIYEYQVLVLITCLGVNSADILNDLKRRFSFESVRQKIYKDSGDLAVFQRSGNVESVKEFLETDFEGAANLEVTINFTTSLKDDESSVIDSTVIEASWEGLVETKEAYKEYLIRIGVLQPPEEEQDSSEEETP